MKIIFKQPRKIILCLTKEIITKKLCFFNFGSGGKFSISEEVGNWIRAQKETKIQVCSQWESFSLERYKSFKEVSASMYTKSVFEIEKLQKGVKMSLKAAHRAGITIFTWSYYQLKNLQTKILDYSRTTAKVKFDNWLLLILYTSKICLCSFIWVTTADHNVYKCHIFLILSKKHFQLVVFQSPVKQRKNMHILRKLFSLFFVFLHKWYPELFKCFIHNILEEIKWRSLSGACEETDQPWHTQLHKIRGISVPLQQKSRNFNFHSQSLALFYVRPLLHL